MRKNRQVFGALRLDGAFRGGNASSVKKALPCQRTPDRSFAMAAILVLLTLVPVSFAQDDSSIEDIFRDALYLEEVKGDTTAALEAYEKVTAAFERQRDLAATALYRQAECLRKLNRPEDAAASFSKILSHYPEQERLVKLSRENLIALGKAPDVSEQGTEVLDEEQKEIARLEELLRNSPDLLNTKSGEISSPLHVAAEKGQIEVVKFLLARGAEVDIRRKPDDVTALHRAALAGHLGVCQLLLDAGAVCDSEIFCTALEQRRVSVARLLVEKLENVNDDSFEIRIWNGSNPPKVLATPLGIACKNGDVDLVKALIEKGANINAYMRWTTKHNGKGMTPLGFAVQADSIECVEALLQSKVELDLPSGEEQEPPLLDAIRKEDLRMATLLKDSGADLAAVDGAGRTILHRVAGRGLVDWLPSVLEAGIDIDAQDIHGRTALRHAWSQQKMIKSLLEKGADPNLYDEAGGTILSDLAERWYAPGGDEYDRYFASIKILLDSGAVPNGRALEAAVGGVNAWSKDHCWIEAAQLFLERGAKPTVAGALHVPYPSRPLKGEILELYNEFWEVAHIRENKNRSNAVWVSSAKNAIEMERYSSAPPPQFEALVGSDGGASTTSLPQLVRIFIGESRSRSMTSGLRDVSIRRLSDEGNADEMIIVDFVDLLTKGDRGDDLILSWGDIVNIPHGDDLSEDDKRLIEAWFSEPGAVEIRIEPAPGQVLSNISRTDGNGCRFQWAGATIPLEMVRFAGTRSILAGSNLAIWRCAPDSGVLTIVPKSKSRNSTKEFVVRHGDVLRAEIAPAFEGLSDRKLASGIYVAHAEAGPFWKVGKSQPTVSSVLLGLCGPSGMPVHAIDWQNAKIKIANRSSNNVGQFLSANWKELPLRDNLSMDLRQGNLLILPPAEGAEFKVDSKLESMLRDKFTFNWDLYVDDQLATVSQKFEPLIMSCMKEGEEWIWRTTESNFLRPWLPVERDLIGSVSLNLIPEFPDRWLSKDRLRNGSEVIPIMAVETESEEASVRQIRRMLEERAKNHLQPPGPTKVSNAPRGTPRRRVVLPASK